MNLTARYKLLAVCTVSALGGLASADPVTNGDFTGGSLAGWTVTGSPTWYPWTGAAAGINPVDGVLAVYDDAFTGANTGVEGTSTISQDLTLTAGQAYKLTLFVASDDVELGGSPDNFITASVGGHTVLSALDYSDSPSQANWLELSGYFVAGSDGTLAITAYDNPDATYMTDVSVSSAPSPAAILPFVAGVIGLRRRRSR
jgi:hypothetical protein